MNFRLIALLLALWPLVSTARDRIPPDLESELKVAGFRPAKNKSDEREMTAFLVEWARVAPFPKERTFFRIMTGGDQYTRSFRALFATSKPVLDQWLRDSPSMRDAVLVSDKKGRKVYELKPGGVGYASLTVFPQSGCVIVYAFAS